MSQDMKYESIPVPFMTDKKKRRYLTGKQLIQNRELADFVRRFETHFRLDPRRDVYWYEPKKVSDG